MTSELRNTAAKQAAEKAQLAAERLAREEKEERLREYVRWYVNNLLIGYAIIAAVVLLAVWI